MCYQQSLQWPHRAAWHFPSPPQLNRSPKRMSDAQITTVCWKHVFRVVNWCIQRSQILLQKLSDEQSATAIVSDGVDCRPIWQSDSTIVLTLLLIPTNVLFKVEMPPVSHLSCFMTVLLHTVAECISQNQVLKVSSTLPYCMSPSGLGPLSC